MGFYLRKSFRAGPVRINLSKSGLGLSAGIRGLRVGSGPRGSYIHAGRKGLYYRKKLSGGKSRQSDSGSLVTLIGFIVGIAIIVYVVNWFIENPIVFFSLVATAIGLIALTVIIKYRSRSLISSYKMMLDSCFVLMDREVTDDLLSEIRSKKSKVSIQAKISKTIEQIEKDVYEALLDRILDDRLITSEEKYLIKTLESIVTLDEGYLKETKIELFKLYYLDVISDHYVSEQELRSINNIKEGLKIDEWEVQEEMSTINDIIKAQELKEPLPPLDTVPLKLQKAEIPFYFGRASVLSRRKAKKGSGKEYEYSIKREGDFVITNKRVIVVKEGTTTVKMDDILDVDVDLDSKVIVVSKGSADQPTFFQTKDAIVAGRIIDMISGSR
jgi:hypothetical protein